MFRVQQYIKATCNQDNKGVQLSPQNLERLQNHLFSMYKDIEKICIQHNLNIILAAGNVLGAIRHGGWIPWDDDLDIYMPREDYDKFIKIYAYELPDKYIVYSLNNDNGPITRFAKVIDMNTIFIPLVDISPKHIEGVFIDIFPYDNVPTNRILHKFKKMIGYGLMFIQNSVNQHDNITDDYKKVLCATPQGRRAYYLRNSIGYLFSIISLTKWYKLFDRLIRNNTSSDYLYCGVSTSTAWHPIPKSYLFPGKKFIFPNGETAFIPREPEKYLTYAYGEWRIIPNDKNKWHHYVKDFNLPS